MSRKVSGSPTVSMASFKSLPPSDTARIHYNVLVSAGIALDPTVEVFSPPIFPASDVPQTMIVRSWDRNRATAEPIFLVRKDDATQAYALTDADQRPVPVGEHRHPQWGSIFFAVVYAAIGPNTFQEPSQNDAQFVAIKRLHKGVVQHYLSLGGVENPYKEMMRMEELGDNTHVLRHVELLEDETYLYIVSPRGHTLKDTISWFDSENVMDSHRSHQIFCKILHILLYLEKHGINHHDASPDNFLFLSPSNLVVFDLALSLRIPINPATGHRALIAANENVFGTVAWMDPVVYWQKQYDGIAMDLWAAGVILYNLLTNLIIYKRPHPDDWSFRYCIIARGLSLEPLNERAIELLREVEANEELQNCYQKLAAQATAHLNMAPRAMELLEKMLKIHPAERPSLAQVIESAYVMQG